MGLTCELLRGRDCNGAYALSLRPAQPSEHRDQERGCLARTGRSTRQHLASRNEEGHGLHLDSGELVVSGLQDIVAKPWAQCKPLRHLHRTLDGRRHACAVDVDA